MRDDGRVVGSALIGQAFAGAVLFPPAPVGGGIRATSGDSSNGTNKGPTDRKLADTLIAQAVDSAVANDGAVKGQDPVRHGDILGVGSRSGHLPG